MARTILGSWSFCFFLSPLLGGFSHGAEPKETNFGGRLVPETCAATPKTKHALLLGTVDSRRYETSEIDAIISEHKLTRHQLRRHGLQVHRRVQRRVKI